MRPAETHPFIEQEIAAESTRSHFQPIFFYDSSRCLEYKHKLKSPWRKVSPLKCAALNTAWPKCHSALNGPTAHGHTEQRAVMVVQGLQLIGRPLAMRICRAYTALSAAPS